MWSFFARSENDLVENLRKLGRFNPSRSPSLSDQSGMRERRHQASPVAAEERSGVSEMLRRADGHGGDRILTLIVPGDARRLERVLLHVTDSSVEGAGQVWDSPITSLGYYSRCKIFVKYPLWQF